MIEKIARLYNKYHEAILYLFFGGLTTVVNYVVYFVGARYLPVSGTTLPTVIAWILAVIFAYLTNRVWVFHSNARGGAQLLREMGAFVGARVLSGLLDVAVMWLAVDVLGFNDLVIKLLSNVLVVVINYVLSKFWIFKKSPPKK